jgi:hypothetical protein
MEATVSREPPLFAIALLCAALTMGYGVLHDLVTIRISPEYFTVARAPVIATDSPTLLAAAWGIAATWWVGVPLGLILGLAATTGSRAPASARSLAPSLVAALGLTAGFAALAGMLGFFAASTGFIHVVGPLAHRLSPRGQIQFVAVLWTHLASYATGGVLALVVIVRTWLVRTGTPVLAPSAGD